MEPEGFTRNLALASGGTFAVSNVIMKLVLRVEYFITVFAGGLVAIDCLAII